MSTQATTWAWEQDGIGPGAKLLLVAIADRADDAGVAFPGHASLAKWCCCARETVGTNMRKLEQEGLVARVERRRPNGSRTSDWIVLGPRWEARFPMVDADVKVHHEDVIPLAVKTSHEDSSHDDLPPGHVRKTGGPDPSVNHQDPLSSEKGAVAGAREPSRKERLEAEFEDFASTHEHVTGQAPPRKGTQARRAVFASFCARRQEDYSLADLKLASAGAQADDFRRTRGYTTPESVLRPTMVAGLIERGRQAQKVAPEREKREEVYGGFAN